MKEGYVGNRREGGEGGRNNMLEIRDKVGLRS